MARLSPRTPWNAVRSLTLCMLAVWLLVSVAAPWCARALNDSRLFGFPAGYWLVAQGALLFFIALVVVFVLWVERIETRGAADAANAEADRP